MKNVFLYSGQGSQYYHMGSQLYHNHGRFRLVMDELDDLIYQLYSFHVVPEIYNPEFKSSDPFRDLRITHFAIFMVEYAMTQVISDQGIRPDVVVGASLGEIAAACVSNMLTVDQALQLVNNNANAVESTCSNGAMLAVIGDIGLLNQSGMSSDLEVAGVNYKEHFVVSGEISVINELKNWLSANNAISQILPVDYAFHSSLIEPAKAEISQYLQMVNFSKPLVTYYSCSPPSSMDVDSAQHFWQAFREPICFYDTVRSINIDHANFIDLGPSGTMATFAKNIFRENKERIFPLMSPYGGEMEKIKSLSDIINSTQRNMGGVTC